MSVSNFCLLVFTSLSLGIIDFFICLGIFRRKKLLGLYFTFGVLVMNLFTNFGMLVGMSNNNIPAYLLLFLIHILWGVYFFNRRSIFVN